MSGTETLFLDAGRILAGLPGPMGFMETRAFAGRAINRAATMPSDEHQLAAVCGFIQPELTLRGAERYQIELVGRAVLHAVTLAQTLTEAREILGSVWAGVLIVEN
jgi:hypothetical protein